MSKYMSYVIISYHLIYIILSYIFVIQLYILHHFGAPPLKATAPKMNRTIIMMWNIPDWPISKLSSNNYYNIIQYIIVYLSVYQRQ